MWVPFLRLRLTVIRVVYHYYVDSTVPLVYDPSTKIVIDHKCRVTNCYEPTHLRAVVQRKNIDSGLLSALNVTKTSRHVGVSWHKRNKKWAAQIHENGAQRTIGYFDDEDDASHAYQLARMMASRKKVTR